MSSQSASTFANQVVAFVIPWLVLSRTGSALNAGGAAFALIQAMRLVDAADASR
jgi:hypothetical protein